jgi:tripartite-type tricarboxylate transporter receptor subunit TctC
MAFSGLLRTGHAMLMPRKWTTEVYRRDAAGTRQTPRAVAYALAIAVFTNAPAWSADYYEGRTITLIVGNNASGGYAVNARLLAEYIGRHIPGAPKIVVQYMPGAGGLTLANYIYSAAPRDGFTIGETLFNVPFLPTTGTVPVAFRAEDFTWLGGSYSNADDAYCLIVRSDSPYKQLADLQKPGSPAIFGGQSTGSANVDVVEIARDALHLNIKLIRGYPAPGDISMAMQNGELAGKADGWKTFALLQSDAIKRGAYRCLVQFRPDRWSGLSDVPTALEKAEAPADRQLIELVEAPFLLGRPYMAPPDIPEEAAAILRKAFRETHSDPGFLAENEKLDFSVSAQSDEELLGILRNAARTPAAVIARYKADLGGK